MIMLSFTIITYFGFSAWSQFDYILNKKIY